MVPKHVPWQEIAEERLGLLDCLVYLPVRRDDRRAVTQARTSFASCSASTPGSGRPSNSSSDAPPPVDEGLPIGLFAGVALAVAVLGVGAGRWSLRRAA